MKEGIKSVLQNLARNNLVWTMVKPIAIAGHYMFMSRKRKIENSGKNDPNLKRVQASITESLVVKHGPFKGLIYPSKSSTGSALYPKLLGSYERELHPEIEDLLKNDYSEILDVGSAEGYYAIGTAMRSPSSKVYAFDTNPRAQGLCSQMAKVNSVEERVEVGSTLTPKALGQFKFTGRALIISDCEGFEIDLFNKSNIGNLKNCDVLIETHDFVNLDISTTLKEVFSETHNISSVYSLDDIHKAIMYDYPELKDLTLQGKREVLREGRARIMEWVICRSKTASQST